MPDFQAFVFDFDGVLADSVEVKTRAFEALYLPFGPEVTARVAAYHREHGGMTRREKFRHFETELLDRPATEARLDELCAAFSKLVLEGVVAAPEIPGAMEFLRRWHGRVPLYVDSATPDGELAVILARRGLDVFFAGAYGSSRSKAANLAAILATGCFAPERVLFLGDAMSDFKAAQACGTAFLGMVRTGDSPLLELSPAPPLCHDFFEVAERLAGENR